MPTGWYIPDMGKNVG